MRTENIVKFLENFFEKIQKKSGRDVRTVISEEVRKIIPEGQSRTITDHIVQLMPDFFMR